MNQRIPSIEEQWEASNYVLYRPLPRPNDNLFSALKTVFPYVLAAALSGLLLFGGLRMMAGKSSGGFSGFVLDHPLQTWLILFLVLIILEILLNLRRVLVTLVRLYQHYAPERIRRRCQCKPTCSEYALLVLEREKNLFQALRKICIRLTRTCKGDYYKIDYPE